MPVSNELFLLSCINHSNQGKIAFGEVALECDMVSKMAATLRFRRFKEKHDMSLLNIRKNAKDGKESAGASESPAKSATSSKQTPRKGGGAMKKRKLEEDVAVKHEPEIDDAEEEL